MQEEIENELNYWQNQKFTGCIKFGIEANEIMTLTITTDLEYMAKNRSPESYQDKFNKICASQDKFYGNFVFTMEFGKITNFNWYATLKGTELKSKLIKHRNKANAGM